jgi:hypothetical protein
VDNFQLADESDRTSTPGCAVFRMEEDIDSNLRNRGLTDGRPERRSRDLSNEPQVSFRVGSTNGLGSEDAGEEARPDRVTESGIVDFPALASCRPAGQDRQMGSLVSLQAMINNHFPSGST